MKFLYFVFRLEEETASLQKVRDKMKKKLAKYIVFQQYLDKVLEKAEEVQITELPLYKKFFANHSEIITFIKTKLLNS